MTFWLAGLFFWGTLFNGTPTPLAPYTTQVIHLDAAVPSQSFTFSAVADESWSFSAVNLPEFGSVDPILRLLDSDGNLLLANDNETPTSLNARLENWSAPTAATYIVEVSRVGTSTGSLRLTATADEHSLALAPLPIPPQVSLAPGQVYDLISALDSRHSPLRLRFHLPELPLNQALALQLRFGQPQGVGDWLLILSRAGIAVQTTALNAEDTLFEQVILSQDARLTAGSYELWLAPDRLTLSLDNANPIEITPPAGSNFLFLRPGAEALRLLAMPTNSVPLIIEQPYASTAFYNERVLVAAALPPAAEGERLFAYQENPIRVVEELRQGEYVGTGGGLALTMPEGLLETSVAGFNSLPVTMSEGFGDFVLSFYASLRAGSPDAACGMTFRQVDSANFVTVLFAADGSAYILPYQEGALLDESLAVQTPWLQRGLRAENHVLLLAQGEEATLFLNGYLIGTTPIPQGSGTFSFNMVVNTPELTRCTYRNIWLWEL